MRVEEHPILGTSEKRKKVTIYYGDRPIEALESEPIAAALINAGIRAFRKTPKLGTPRGIFCAIGRCTDCMMTVDGKPNVRTCITLVRDGMHVEFQEGLGRKEVEV